MSDFLPIKIHEVEISRPLSSIPAFDSVTRQKYERALIFVRLHGQPIGFIELDIPPNGVTVEEVACLIWEEYKTQINQHVRDDGCSEIDTLGPGGFTTRIEPNCIKSCYAILANAPFVSIVIATRDRPTSLTRCIDSLLLIDYPNYEIIIVDNAPTSNSTSTLIHQKYGNLQQVRYLFESSPGLANAHNRGLMVTRASLVAFTDDDVVVDALWLIQLVAGFNAADNVGCVTGMILPAELQTPSQMWIERYGNFNKGFTRCIFDMTENRHSHPLYPYTAGMFGSGANMAFQTSVLKEMGGFDPALGAGSGGYGGDDLAAFFDVITGGYKLVYEPSAMVWHWHRRDYEGLKRSTYGYGVGLTAYLMKTLTDNPRRLWELLLKMRHGFNYILSTQSEKNIKKPKDYPRELTKIERKGMLHGPFAYIKSRRQSRRYRQELDLEQRSA